MKRYFEGRKALVIGGSGGIGKAVSIELGRQGAEVVVHGGHSEERLCQTVSAVRDAGGSARGFLLALEDSQLQSQVPALLEAMPFPDILVCALGPFRRQSLEEMNYDAWAYMVTANLTLPGILVSSALKAMIEREWGRIILFGGTNTDQIRGFRSTVAYSSAKTALGVLAKSVALTAGSFGVSCNVICPGMVDTEYLTGTSRRYALEHAPGAALINPINLAHCIVDLMKDTTLNGAIIPMDGGIRI